MTPSDIFNLTWSFLLVYIYVAAHMEDAFWPFTFYYKAFHLSATAYKRMLLYLLKHDLSQVKQQEKI